MAVTIFLSEKEAQEWGLVPKKYDSHSIKQKVIIRVLAGLVVVLITMGLGYIQYVTHKPKVVPNEASSMLVHSA